MFHVNQINRYKFAGMQKLLVVICGPTGIGKTRVAIDVAKHFNSEIISADSRQVYKEMSIGTAVPSPDELNMVHHHFIHSHSIHQYYNASMFELEVLHFLEYYYQGHNQALMVGGSGLYIDAVCKGIDYLPAILPEVREKWKSIYNTQGIDFLQKKVEEVDPDYFQQVDKNNPKRLLKALEVYEMTGRAYSSFLTKSQKKRFFKTCKIGLNTDRETLYRAINKRVDGMMHAGLVDEANQLFEYRQLTQLKTVGYKELFAHFEGTLSLEEAVEQIKNHTRAYARRQLTWFRNDEEITWFEPDDTEKILRFIEKETGTK
jgi:tRNA dimethylallyltransferase